MTIDNASNQPRYCVADLNGNVLDPYTNDVGDAVGLARSHAFQTSTPTHVYRWERRGRYMVRVPVWRSEVEGRARRPDGTTAAFHTLG